MLARLAEALGTGNLDHRIAEHDLSDGAVAQPFAMPSAEIEQADAIVLVGSNLRHELPLLHQRMRKAWTRGAKVYAVNPVDFDFAFDIAAGKQHRRAVEAGRRARLDSDARCDALKDATRRRGHRRRACAENGVRKRAAIRAAASRISRRRPTPRCAAFRRARTRLAWRGSGVLPQTRGALDMLAEPRGAYVLYGIEPGLDFADQCHRAQGPGRSAGRGIQPLRLRFDASASPT